MTRDHADPPRLAAFLRYVALGTLVFGVDLVVTLGLARYWHYLVANTIAFIIANLLQFVVAHVWVFRRELSMRAFVRLYPATLSISVLGLLCSNVLVFLGVDVLALSLFVTKVLTAIVVLALNYSLRVALLYRSDAA